jgi:5'-nucleotidase
MKRTIIVTNDDGYDAAGLRALVEALAPLGRVIVVAPASQRSAVSHSITLHKPLRLTEEAPDQYACSGSPADCVYIALNALCRDARPDLVVSGINRGSNVGFDVFYSGTVAGAMEGVILGIPGIAVSQTAGWESISNGDFDPIRDYPRTARVAARLAAEVLERGLPAGIMLNVNVPCNYDPAKGVKVVRLGRLMYEQLVDERVDPRGVKYYWIGGEDEGYAETPGTDCVAIKEGYATVTPVTNELTHTAMMKELEEWL